MSKATTPAMATRAERNSSGRNQPETQHRAVVQQVPDRVDDDGGEYRFRQVVELAGQKQQGESNRRGCRNRRNLRLSAIRIVGCGSGSTTANLHAVKDRRGRIGYA